MKDYPVIRICLMFMGGIILQKIFAPGISVLFILAAFFTLLSLINLKWKSTESLLLVLSSIVIFLAGAVYFGLYKTDLKPYPFQVSRLKDVALWGKVSSVDLKRDYEIRFLLKSDSLRLNDKTYSLGLSVICRLRDEEAGSLDSAYKCLNPGQYVMIKGTFSKGRQRRNPGEFDYQNYLEERGISALHTAFSTGDISILYQAEKMPLEELVFSVRKSIDEVFSRLHTKNCASLLRGFLLADRSEVDEEVQSDFINTGVVHILAVSGSNVLLIIMIFTLLFGRFNVVVRSVLTLTGLFLFLIITGSSPSVVRAVTMGAVGSAAFLTNRSYNVFNLLAIAAVIILGLNPNQLFDSGFQLSFAAVISIAVIYPHLKSLLDRLNIKSAIIYKPLLFISVTIAAEVGVLPFTLYYFGRVSVVSLPANLLVIPLSFLISALGIVTLVLNPVSQYIASVYAGMNNLFADVLIYITHLLGSLSVSYLSIREFTLADLLISYTFLCGYFIVIRRLESLLAKWITALLCVINIFLFCSLDNKSLLPEHELTIMAIDVGQGDATLVKFPDNTTILIDAGPVSRYSDSGENTIFPLLNRLGIDKIDYGFISHVDNDHYSGFISLIKKGVIRKIFKPRLDKNYPKDLSLEQFLKKSRIPILYYRKGSLKFGNAKVYILNTEELGTSGSLNDRSGVIKIVYGSTSFLFEGDAGKMEEGILAEEYGDFLSSDFLKMGHHGSKHSSSSKMLALVKPSYGLISAGVQNRFGHPSKEVLERSRQFSIRLLRTDQEGAIILRSNGDKIRKAAWKE
ncbi:MAG: DNA internalization-related competence protein ComEC/Rec2 [Ignavibacteria bacterium]|jgi:competence protein ComEC|nr:DNA internalization-related competence protein ComEC/Rec2 [Ignavibacteria bacterium]MCU7519979.1 DNA internalization-related competence protein ComEC/Rec2 [Ignavibacteria bacterium]